MWERTRARMVGKSGKLLHVLQVFGHPKACENTVLPQSLREYCVTPKLARILCIGVSLETLLHIHDRFHHWPSVSCLTFGSCPFFRRCKSQPSNHPWVFPATSPDPEAKIPSHQPCHQHTDGIHISLEILRNFGALFQEMGLKMKYMFHNIIRLNACDENSIVLQKSNFKENEAFWGGKRQCPKSEEE